MYINDLLTTLSADVAGWLPTDASTHGRATHNTLLNVVETAAITVRSGELSRRGRKLLIQKIDELAAMLLAESFRCSIQLANLNAPLLLNIKGATSEADRQLRIQSRVRVEPFRKAVRLAIALRRLPAAEQGRALQFMKAQVEIDLRRDFNTHFGDLSSADIPSQLAGLRDALMSMVGSMDVRQEVQLSPTSLAILKEADWHVDHRLVPTSVRMQLSAAELETLSAVFLRLGQAAFMDLPHDEDVSESQRRRSKALWRTLSEYGDAFRVISVWLLALTDDTEVPRCELCYRHLGRGQKHFCETHRRTSHARHSARDAHIGRAYRFAVNEGLRSQSMVEAMKSFAQNTGRVLPLHVQISRKMLCSTPDSPAKILVGPAAALASFLHRLHPFLSPSIDELVQSHFVKMLATARAPFLTSPTTQEAALKVHALRTRAPAWLTWRNFVLTLFASERPKGDEAAFVGEKFLGLDADHPSARGMSVSPRSVCLDLWHLRTWKLTERGFDQSAYVHPDVIRKLRRSGPNGKPLSLRAIGNLLGISHEAVRKHLASKESNVKRPPRKRVLPMAQSKQVAR